MKLFINGSDIEMKFTKEERDSCAHQGECYDDCKALVEKHPILFNRIKRDLALKACKVSGGWTLAELQEMETRELHIRIVWMGAGSAKDESSLWGLISGY